MAACIDDIKIYCIVFETILFCGLPRKEYRRARDKLKENAYFTVEAALVFPVAAGMILFIVYMLLFQYDRCLLEQDMGAAALWGSRLEGEDAEALCKRIQDRLLNIYQDKYAAWEFAVLRASIEKNGFSVQGEGRLVLGGAGDAWSAKAEYRYDRLSPTAFIRLCGGVANLLEKDENAGTNKKTQNKGRREEAGCEGQVKVETGG